MSISARYLLEVRLVIELSGNGGGASLSFSKTLLRYGQVGCLVNEDF